MSFTIFYQARPFQFAGRSDSISNKHVVTASRPPEGENMDRRRFMAGCAGLSSWLTANRAFAQSGPLTKIVFPFAAGAGGDTLCRLIAEHLRPLLDRPVLSKTAPAPTA
jgi:hypothetical protein